MRKMRQMLLSCSQPLDPEAHCRQYESGCFSSPVHSLSVNTLTCTTGHVHLASRNFLQEVFFALLPALNSFRCKVVKEVDPGA